MKLFEVVKRFFRRLFKKQIPENPSVLSFVLSDISQPMQRLAQSLEELNAAFATLTECMANLSKALDKVRLKPKVRYTVPRFIGNKYPYMPTIPKNLPYQRRTFYSTKGRC